MLVTIEDSVCSRAYEGPRICRQAADAMYATVTSATRTQNQLLAALPLLERERLTGDAMSRFVEAGDVLYEPGQPVSSVYFPVTSEVSVLASSLP